MKPLRGKQSKHWVFTINNPQPKDWPDTDAFEYIIIAKEVGEKGTPHLQGYCVFKKTQRATGAKKSVAEGTS